MKKYVKILLNTEVDRMKIIVTGSKGQLGTDVVEQLNSIGVQAICADLPEIDITDAAAVEAFVAKSKADAIIHCAAFTNVDLAETDRETCKKVNADGTLNIALACKKHGLKLLYLSTDYVLNGEGDSPFNTSDVASPCNYYGETKLMGEKAVVENCEKHFIVRISWVFGENGKNFVKTMLKLAETRDEISVVCDQTGSPTYTKDLSVLLCEMIQTEKYGIYHATNEGFCSWAEFAAEIMKLSDSKTKIIPIPTSEYKSVAARPLNSRLSKESLDINGFNRLPHWQDALKRYLGVK